MRILVAQEKPRMARLLQRALQKEGYFVTLAEDGEHALSLGISGGLDMIVLDTALPRRDGFDVIKNLRAANRSIPAIMVSAHDTSPDIVRGLDLGADDYLAHPFSVSVFLARLRALSRRGPIAYPADLKFEDLILNSRTHQLQRGSRVVALTRTEYALLEILMRRAGCIVPRSALAEAGWGSEAEVTDSTLYVFIRTLRSKISQPGECQLLHTARGVGYMLKIEPV